MWINFIDARFQLRVPRVIFVFVDVSISHSLPPFSLKRKKEDTRKKSATTSLKKLFPTHVTSSAEAEKTNDHPANIPSKTEEFCLVSIFLVQKWVNFGEDTQQVTNEQEVESYLHGTHYSQVGTAWDAI